MQVLSAGGLLGYGLTITFASFDWLMSLEPHWFSTIYGVLIMGGQALSAMAFSIVVLAWLVAARALQRADYREPLSRPRQPDDGVHDAVDLLRVLAVPDHLGGEHPRRDRVVSPSHRPRLAVHRPGARRLSFRRAVHGAAAPRHQAQRGHGVESGGADLS